MPNVTLFPLFYRLANQRLTILSGAACLLDSSYEARNRHLLLASVKLIRTQCEIKFALSGSGCSNWPMLPTGLNLKKLLENCLAHNKADLLSQFVLWLICVISSSLWSQQRRRGCSMGREYVPAVPLQLYLLQARVTHRPKFDNQGCKEIKAKGAEKLFEVTIEAGLEIELYNDGIEKKLSWHYPA